MNIDAIISSLKEERSRIDAAIKALGGVTSSAKVASHGTSDGAGKKKRHVSLASRRKMAAAQKARWAKRKAGK
jgi:hypothetical protein